MSHHYANQPPPLTPRVADSGTSGNQLASVPSYAQPKNLHRRQPPLLERVRQFVEEFGTKTDANELHPKRSADYYTNMCVSLSRGLTNTGAAPAGRTRRVEADRRALTEVKQMKRPASSSGQGGTGGVAAVRQLRERMHRASQGIPIAPLPAKLIQQFVPKEAALEPPADKAEYDALTWLGLLRVRRCGLCCVEFPTDALVTQVSMKAIRGKQREWQLRSNDTAKEKEEGTIAGVTGVFDPPLESLTSGRNRHMKRNDDKLAEHAATWMYSSTRVCRFCSQFFGVFLGSTFKDDVQGITTAAAPAAFHLHRRPTRSPASSSSSGATTDADEDDDSTGGDSSSPTSEGPRDEGRKGAVAPEAAVRRRSPSVGSHQSSRTSSLSSASPRIRDSEPVSAVPERPRVASLARPSRQVIVNRASLLRLTSRHQHSYVEPEVPIKPPWDNRLAHADEGPRRGVVHSPPAVSDKASKHASRGGPNRSRPHSAILPVAEQFVLGPSDESERDAPRATDCMASPQNRRQLSVDSQNSLSSEEKAADRDPPVRLPSPAHSTKSKPAIASVSVESGHVTSLDSEQQQPMCCPWSGRIRVLIMCCHAYTDAPTLPAAAATLAKRLGHWFLTHVLFADGHSAMDGAGSGVDTDEHPAVRVLCNDAVDAPSITAFLLECAKQHDAPVMVYMGLVGPVEDNFSDVSLIFTAASSWPATVRPFLSEPNTCSPQRTSSPACASSTRTLREKTNKLHEVPCVNPLKADTNSNRNTKPMAPSTRCVTVQSIDRLCAALRLPAPLLLIDACAGPLVMAATTALVVLHPNNQSMPSHQTPPLQKSQSRGVSDIGVQRDEVSLSTNQCELVEAVRCGAVVEGFLTFLVASCADAMLHSHAVAQELRSPLLGQRAAPQTQRGSQIRWDRFVTEMLVCDKGNEAGAMAQELFREHFPEDAPSRSFLATCPLTWKSPVVVASPQSLHLQPSVVLRDYGWIEPLRHTLESREARVDTMKKMLHDHVRILLLPVGSKIITMHRRFHVGAEQPTSQVSPSTQGAEAVLLLREADRILESQAVTFAVRLHPRHTVTRMSSMHQRQQFTSAVESVFRAESFIPPDRLMLTFIVSLSGHVTTIFSAPSEPPIVLQEIAKTVIKSLPRLRQQYGWVVMDYGFLTSHEVNAEDRQRLVSEEWTLSGGADGAVVLDAREPKRTK